MSLTRIITQTATKTRTHLPQTLIAAGVGGLGFVWIQTLTGTTNIAEFVGQKIVQTGGYPAVFASPIGWTVHLAIAVQYAVAMTVLLALPIWPTERLTRVTIKIAAAIAVGFIGTWVANPAISVTVSFLGGAGWPAELYPVNTKFGVPLLNHVLFFLTTLAATDGVTSLVAVARRYNPVMFEIAGEDSRIDDTIILAP